ncbi:MAG: hypothetical protein AAGF02_01575 [Actinomycetota bacterium]
MAVTPSGSGELDAATNDGELDLDGGCFLRIRVPERLVTHGLGRALRTLVSDPLGGGGAVEPASSTFFGP